MVGVPFLEAQLLFGASALGFVVKILLSLQITLAGILLVPHRLGGASALPERPPLGEIAGPAVSERLAENYYETHSRLRPRGS